MSSRIQTFPIVGHRGAARLIPPGNTVRSLQRAVEVGAQMLEVDVRRTRDDVLVLEHDAVRLIGGQDTPIRERSWAEWRARTEDTDAPMATLEDAFAIASRANVGLMLDFKDPGMESLLARAIRQSGFPLDRLLVPGANELSRATLRSLDPRIPLSLTLDEDAPPITAKLLAELDTDAVTWHHKLLTPAIVKVLRLRRIVAYAWTVDQPDDMRRLRADIGVDGIITNSPDLLRALPA